MQEQFAENEKEEEFDDLDLWFYDTYCQKLDLIF